MNTKRVSLLCLSMLTGSLLVISGCGSTSTTPAAEPAPPAQQATPAVAPEPAPKPYDAVPLIPREVLFGNPTRLSPQLSPDGKRLAYLAPHEGVLNVWVKTIGKDDDRVITADKKRGIRSMRWAPNGKQLLYIQDQDGDENWHVYATPATGGNTRDLTPVKGVQARIEAIEPSQPNTILIGLNDRDPKVHDIYRLDLKTGKRKQVLKNDLGAIGFVADHKFNVRIAQRFTPDGGIELLHRARPGAKWNKVLAFSAEDGMTSSAVAFTGDNRNLLLIASDGSNTAELRSFDPKGKKMKVIAADPDADVADLEIHPTRHTVQAVGFNRDRLTWKVIDSKVEADFKALGELHKGDFRIISRDKADKTWLVAYDQDDGPVLYYSYSRASKKGEFLFSHRPELEQVKLAEMKPVSYGARDGLTIHAYLTTPPGIESKNLPAVVFPHGGPWYRDSWGYDPTAQWLANRGYAVLQPNFRGSTGYGKKFLNAGDREWGGLMQDDITDGTNWLISQGIADPKRIAIMGGSYGGYATLMGLVREPDLYVCGVDIVGVANLITWMQTIPPYWQPFKAVLVQRVGDPEKDAAFLKSRSPVFLADQIKAPLLIAQGANDPRVPKAESLQIRDALQKQGREVQYVEFPDEGHGFARPENRLKFYGMAEPFLARYLGGRTE